MTASEQIDRRIADHPDWRGKLLEGIRRLVRESDPEILEEHKFSLQQIAPCAQVTVRYEYDFGDSWQHIITVEKILPLKNLQPGSYELRMKVTDKIRNQVLTPSAQFTVL